MSGEPSEGVWKYSYTALVRSCIGFLLLTSYTFSVLALEETGDINAHAGFIGFSIGFTTVPLAEIALAIVAFWILTPMLYLVLELRVRFNEVSA